MKVMPNIEIKYNKFPSNYINDVNGWEFSKEEVEKTKGQLTTLDIDFGIYCSLNCPHCFRKDNETLDNDKHILNFDRLKELILSAKKLGLKSVKFLGAGEPFENTKFLEFLRFLKSEDVIPLIFTKAHVIADEELIKRFYGHYGINTPDELIEELNKCNVSLMVGFNSADTELQDKMVGDVKGYSLKRNKALELLVKHGFNDFNPTRLAIAINPITNLNKDEVVELYKWARVRNIYAIVTTTMMSGRGLTTWRDITPPEDEIIDIYTKIYKFNLETNLQTIEQIEEEGISAYAGGHPCNQVSRGLYISINGVASMCPGTERENHLYGNIWESSLEDIWLNSLNYKMAGKFNCHCPAKDGNSIPSKMYKEVLKILKKG